MESEVQILIVEFSVTKKIKATIINWNNKVKIIHEILKCSSSVQKVPEC